MDPRPATEIATHVGVSVDTVHQVISKYNRFEAAAVETVGKGGRRNEYLMVEQERQFLAPFFARAETGGNRHSRRDQACTGSTGRPRG